MARTFIDPLAEVDFPPAYEPPVVIDADHERRTRRTRAIYELRELTGIFPETLRALPEPLLCALEVKGADPVSCVLEYFTPTWRGLSLDIASRTYAIENLQIPADSWRMIRALLQLDFGTFRELLDESFARAQLAA